MRDIKFRIWYLKEKQFIHFTGIFNQRPEISRTYGTNGYSINYGGWIDCEQFTGLRDKNGKEIYEGDILQNAKTGRKMGTVVFGKIGYDSSWNGMTGFAIKESYQSYDGGFYQLYFSDDFSEVEVCGNIHEKEGD